MSQQTIISQPGLRITLRTGSEGPTYDPYHYSEWTFERNGNRLVYHTGLAEWIKYKNGKTWTIREDQDDLFEVAFRQHTGQTFREWLRIFTGIRESRWRRHRGHDVRQESGYPGEHFTVCHTCDGHVIESSFNESAVI